MTTVIATVQAAEALDSRARFLVRTYGHLLGAIIGFVLFEIAIFSSGVAQPIARAMLSISWLWIMGAFVLGAYLFRLLARSVESSLVQYLGLVGYVLLEGIIFTPLLYVASHLAPSAIPVAAMVTLVGFGALTAVVFRTGRDFTFLRSFLTWGAVMALVMIVATVLFGGSLGLWFSMAMVVFAGGAILHDTSDVLQNFPETHHVAGALELFASMALAFWYVLSTLLDLLDN